MSPIIVITCYFLALAQAGSQSPTGSSPVAWCNILSRHLKAGKAGSSLSKYSHPQLNTLPTSTMAARPQGQQRVPGIESWIMEIPPITRCWVVASVGTSLAVQCQLVAPIQLYFSYNTVFANGQVWRLLTTFTYFGKMSLDLAFHLFFIMRYSRQLEENSFINAKADYLCLLLFNATILLLLSPILTLPFLSSSLAFSLVYIWSRRNPSIRMSLFGLITITAPYLPLALVGFSWLMSAGWESAIGDLVGIVAGHTYYVLQDVWPKEMHHPTGKGPLTAPRALKRLFGDRLSD